MHPHGTSILPATVRDGSVLLSFQSGAADGITLFSRRASEPEFFAIAQDDPSPVMDDRPKLEAHCEEIRGLATLYKNGTDKALLRFDYLHSNHESEANQLARFDKGFAASLNVVHRLPPPSCEGGRKSH